MSTWLQDKIAFAFQQCRPCLFSIAALTPILLCHFQPLQPPYLLLSFSWPRQCGKSSLLKAKWYIRVLPSLPTAPNFSTLMHTFSFKLLFYSPFYQSPNKVPLVFYPVQPLIYIPSTCLSVLGFNFLPCLITPLICYLQLSIFCLPLFLPLSFLCPFLSELFMHH